MQLDDNIGEVIKGLRDCPYFHKGKKCYGWFRSGICRKRERSYRESDEVSVKSDMKEELQSVENPSPGKENGEGFYKKGLF